jgi:hypothetical protein
MLEELLIAILVGAGAGAAVVGDLVVAAVLAMVIVGIVVRRNANV